MAGRKFKEGDIVRILPSVVKKCLGTRGLNAILYTGIVREYVDGGIYHLSDVSSYLPVNPLNQEERRVFRLSRRPGEIVVGFKASDLELETDEVILAALSKPNEVPEITGNYLVSGNLTSGGECRLQSIDWLNVQTGRIFPDCNYLYLDIRSKSVHSVLGNYRTKKVDNVIDLWTIRDRDYRSNWTFINDSLFVVSTEDIQYILDWEKEHQDFIVGGEVL